MHLRYLLPGLGFLVLAVGLGVGLTLKPREIPSALIGKPVPEFDLPAVEGRDGGLSSADLKTGTPVLVNVFASWCGPCRQEHPLFMELARTTDFTITRSSSDPPKRRCSVSTLIALAPPV